MDAEIYVSEQLQSRGYPVFHRNLEIIYDKRIVAELDIVSYDFIIEVKSGSTILSKSVESITSYNMLPPRFTYYVLCLSKTDEEISELITDNPRIKYINSLEYIYKHHAPIHVCNIETVTDLKNFVGMPYNYIQSFTTIYVRRDVCDHVKYTHTHICDTYSSVDNMTFSEKFAAMESRFVYVTAFDDALPFYRRTTQCKHVYISTMQIPNLQLTYYFINCPRIQEKDRQRIYKRGRLAMQVMQHAEQLIA
jgi:hypothetical protein